MSRRERRRKRSRRASRRHRYGHHRTVQSEPHSPRQSQRISRTPVCARSVESSPPVVQETRKPRSLKPSRYSKLVGVFLFRTNGPQ
ncbi:hypothetical protein ANCCAN_07930 [Ancylostoma caninum]|uniref:Uncharacterized protein n=1 Tax=Ancylostoma caninum TaxID=29170 RepID=A0A368GP09_ANCCA|nr:hypothetical protein ANCCAN_07930 [Ancylostoma caninum]